MFTLEQGPFLADVMMSAILNRRPIPGIIDQAPELIEGLDVFLSAFYEVKDERTAPYPNGYFPPLPRSVVTRWVDENKIDRDDVELIESLYYHVAALDLTFREWLHSQQKQPPKKE